MARRKATPGVITPEKINKPPSFGSSDRWRTYRNLPARDRIGPHLSTPDRIQGDEVPAPKVKRQTPETLTEAAEWDYKKAKYIASGWCDTCAAQAAWGHQLGFTKVKSPCSECLSNVSVPVIRGHQSIRAMKWADGVYE